MTNTSNVTPIESKQPAPSAKFSITAMLDGFPVTISCEGRADYLRAMIDRLKAIGAEPPSAKTTVGNINSRSTPICPVHNAPMKASRRPGSFFCPRQTDTGYCDQKA